MKNILIATANFVGVITLAVGLSTLAYSDTNLFRIVNSTVSYHSWIVAFITAGIGLIVFSRLQYFKLVKYFAALSMAVWGLLVAAYASREIMSSIPVISVFMVWYSFSIIKINILPEDHTKCHSFWILNGVYALLGLLILAVLYILFNGQIFKQR